MYYDIFIWLTASRLYISSLKVEISSLKVEFKDYYGMALLELRNVDIGMYVLPCLRERRLITMPI